MTLHDAWRKRLLAAFAVLMVLAAVLTWAISWRNAPAHADSQEWLRQAVASDSTPRPALVLGKTTQVEGKTSSGRAIRAEFTAVKSATGKTVGFAPRLQQPLKEGETISLPSPGGGQIVIQGLPPGESLPPGFTPGRSQP